VKWCAHARDLTARSGISKRFSDKITLKQKNEHGKKSCYHDRDNKSPLPCGQKAINHRQYRCIAAAHRKRRNWLSCRSLG
ncbi:hypothetical protein, partial [Sporosarcina luteola]|uniref:hypothetical protein n=1 Tax=Sporosarcina luteola TaxID=582850 RepID=UPI00203F79FA